LRCGAKRFIVSYEKEAMEQREEVMARTPQEARKKLRASCGQEIKILSVRSAK